MYDTVIIFFCSSVRLLALIFLVFDSGCKLHFLSPLNLRNVESLSLHLRRKHLCAFVGIGCTTIIYKSHLSRKYLMTTVSRSTLLVLPVRHHDLPAPNSCFYPTRYEIPFCVTVQPIVKAQNVSCCCSCILSSIFVNMLLFLTSPSSDN